MFRHFKSRPGLFVFAFYLVCFLARGLEYLVLRTDQTVIGEAFVHKLFGIALLALALSKMPYHWADIGFRANRFIGGTIVGLALGAGVFAIAYGTEYLLLSANGSAPSLRFFVTSYGVSGNRALQGGFAFVVVCILGNIINVIMEEGVFRGLFLRVLEEKHRFLKSCMISSLLFGLWHIAQPVRNVLDGQQSLMGAVMSALLLVTTSTLLAIQYCMLLKVSGAIWAGMAAHFVNNASANLLHVVSTSGTDELQTLRIAIAQTLSFLIVLALYLILKRRENKAQAETKPASTERNNLETE